MNSLAVLDKERGQYAKAERVTADVLETSRRVLGPEHPTTLRLMNNLAVIYRANIA